MTTALNVATSEFEKLDRCASLDHRPRVLLGKMGLDGHDRGVKVIARALRDSGVHVIYSGLWQTPRSLAISARDEDCDVIAASMMSNSHLVLGPRLLDGLKEVRRADLPVHMGGIIPQNDIPALMQAGVRRCFTTGVGLLDIVEAARSEVKALAPVIAGGHATAQLARDISLAHLGRKPRAEAQRRKPKRVIGVTGSPGAGKSTLVAALAAEHTRRAEADPGLGRAAVVAFDPMSPITNGALLGDRLRVDFNRLEERVFYRSLAISGEDYHALDDVIELIGGAHLHGPMAFDTVFIETVGAGQNETKIRGHVGRTAVVLVPGMGDAVQMDKAGILEIADVFVCNKADHPGQNELIRDLRDISGRRRVIETVATHGKGIVELYEALVAQSVKPLILTSVGSALALLPAAARGAASGFILIPGEGEPDRARIWAIVTELNVLDGADALVLLDAMNAAAAAGLSRWVVRSGWLGGGMLERDPATWGPRGLAAWRAWMDRASGELSGVRTRMLVRPHARHAMCDVQRAAGWMSELDRQGPARRALFGTVLEPAALLEPEMEGQAEDHLRRAIETLGPRVDAILVPGCRGRHAGTIEALAEELSPRTRLIHPEGAGGDGR